MNYSKSFDDAREGKVPGYESAVGKPIFSQGVQPVSIDDSFYGQEESPIYYQDEEEIKATVGSCLSMLLLQLVPIFGLYMLIKWSVSTDCNYVRRTFSRALLIFYGILAVAIFLGYLAARVMG